MASTVYQQILAEGQQLHADLKRQTEKAQSQVVIQRFNELILTSQPLRQWAKTQWQLVDSQAKNAEALLQTQAYVQAALGYEHAIVACQQAVEVAESEQEAEKIQKDLAALRIKVNEAKQTAEQYAAEKRVAKPFSDALSLLNQAEKLTTQYAFPQAVEVFNRAISGFEKAKDLAYGAIKEDIQLLQTEIKTAREQALKAKAEEFAASLFEQASSFEYHADTAFAQTDFNQAQELYSQALAGFQQAKDVALIEQQRLLALATQKDSEQLRHDLEAAGLGQEDYRAAYKLHKEAEGLLAGKAWESAINAFNKAILEYRQAHQVYAQTQKDTIERLKTQVQALRATLPDSTDPQWGGRVRHLDEQQHVAQQHEQNKTWAMASTVYQQILAEGQQLHADLQRQAEKEHTQAVIQRFNELISTSQPLRQWAKTQWQLVDSQAKNAEALLQTQAYVQAALGYEHAIVACQQAIEVAKSELRHNKIVEEKALEKRKKEQEKIDKNKADKAQQKAINSRQKTVNSLTVDKASKDFIHADGVYNKAKNALKNNEYFNAYELFTQSTEGYRRH